MTGHKKLLSKKQEKMYHLFYNEQRSHMVNSIVFNQSHSISLMNDLPKGNRCLLVLAHMTYIELMAILKWPYEGKLYFDF